MVCKFYVFSFPSGASCQIPYVQRGCSPLTTEFGGRMEEEVVAVSSTPSLYTRMILKVGFNRFFNNLLKHLRFTTAVTSYYSNGIAQWIGDRSTFGIVHRYSVEKNRSSSSSPQEERGQFPWLIESPFYDGISLVLCSAKEETLQLQTALTRQRHHWYRRLSKSPLNSGFKLSMVEEEGSKSSNRINIVYQPKQLQVDGGDIQLDSIILNNNNTQEEKGPSTAAAAAIAGNGRRDIIICRSNLDNVLGAFLDDAYTSVENGGGQSEQIVSPQKCFIF